MLPDNLPAEQFRLQQVLKIIKKSLMIDNISISLIKPVAEYIASSLTHVINSQILKQKFVKKWEMSYTKNDRT